MSVFDEATKPGHKSISVENAELLAVAESNPEWLEDLRQCVGAEKVHVDFKSRLDRSNDRIPFGRFKRRSGFLLGGLPVAVVDANSIGVVEKALSFAQSRGVPVIPFGMGSGVLGATVPFDGEIILDLSQMSQKIEIDETNFVVVVDAGVCGANLEKVLNSRNFTCGHYPQSVAMSTVGGWLACRGSGQASSRYGSIEHMVVGLKAVLPDGRFLNVNHAPRRSVGPSIIEMFLGSEGTLGVIVEVTLRIWRMPDYSVEQAVEFPSLADGMAALRGMMQSELRPMLARLYDQPETAIWCGDDGESSAQSVILMLEFAGDKAVASAENGVALAICAKSNGVTVPSTALEKWKSKRFQSHSDVFVSEGGFYDTIEVSAPWSEQTGLYDGICHEVAQRFGSLASVSAHWSHAYSDGACMYITMRNPNADDDTGFRIHGEIWETVMRKCLERNVCISHHHGVGFFRVNWLSKELNEGLSLLQGLKNAIDPKHILNPGKLGLNGKG